MTTQQPYCDHVITKSQSKRCDVCGAVVPGSARLAARLRGRYDVGPSNSPTAAMPTTLRPGLNDVVIVHRDRVSDVTIDVRQRRPGEVAVGDAATGDVADTSQPRSPHVAEVMAVRGDTIFPVGHVVAVKPSVGEVQTDNGTMVWRRGSDGEASS